MVADNTILIIALDGAFRQSLEFALEVEGYSVNSYALLTQAAGFSSAAAEAICIVVDESALAEEPAAWQSLERMAGPVILLADGLSPAAASGLTVLTKPINGGDLIHAVHGLAARFGSDYVDSLRT